MIIKTHYLFHDGLVRGDKAQSFGRSRLVYTSHTNVSLHSFKVFPSADFHYDCCRDPCGDKLSRKTGTKSMKPDRGEVICYAKPSERFSLVASVPFPKSWEKK